MEIDMNNLYRCKNEYRMIIYVNQPYHSKSFNREKLDCSADSRRGISFFSGGLTQMTQKSFFEKNFVKMI